MDKKIKLYNIFYIDETLGWTEHRATTDNPKKWIEKNTKKETDCFVIKKINLELFNKEKK